MTVPAIVTSVKPKQKVNAPSPILVTPLGMVTLVKLAHALFPILITVLGITAVMKGQPKNA